MNALMGSQATFQSLYEFGVSSIFLSQISFVLYQSDLLTYQIWFSNKRLDLFVIIFYGLNSYIKHLNI